MHYRRDIDGLRCLAVMPVVLFHTGISWFPGGFVGVDIFFVISGYLITGLIAEEIRNGRFTVLGFYERRVRRIFPALIAMLAVSVVAALWLLFPSDLVAFGKSVVATTLFASNVLFWRESGYFDTPAASKPLLHTWSLAVEEQYYIFFPIMLWLLWRWRQRWTLWIGAVTILSLAISIFQVQTHHASAAFYLLPSRAWELFLGALLAVGAFPKIRHDGLREAAALLGLVLIAWGIVMLSGLSPFPGSNALFPCIGAALLIHTGEATWTGRMLGLRPLVFIGLISYSLYLWHWPVIVFLHEYGVYQFTPSTEVLVVAGSMALATLSWRYVERPFRARAAFNRRQIFAYGLGGMTALAGIGFAGYLSTGLPARFSPQAIEVAHYQDLRDRRELKCTHSRSDFEPEKLCHYGAAVEPHTAVWGDSHAGAMIAALGKVAAAHDQAIEFVGHSGCPPMEGVTRVDDPTCGRFNEQAIEHLKAEKDIQTVILISRYAINLYGGTYDFGPAEEMRPHAPLIAWPDGAPIQAPAAESLFAAQMPKTVRALTDAGKSVVLVYPIPETGYDVPKVAARMIAHGEDPTKFVRPADYYRRREHFIIATLDALGPADKITRIRPADLFCNQQDCSVFKDGVPLYRDDNHLSGPGALMVAHLLDPVFAAQQPSTASNLGQ
jgi:peptidoglycan/LPS O-acetylase OafA/YrhL